MPGDAEGSVLARHRQPKPGDPRRGLTFVGGHVETATAFTAPASFKPTARRTAGMRVIKEKTDVKVVMEVVNG